MGPDGPAESAPQVTQQYVQTPRPRQLSPPGPRYLPPAFSAGSLEMAPQENCIKRPPGTLLRRAWSLPDRRL